MQAYPFLWGKNRQMNDWCCIAEPEVVGAFKGVARDVLLEAQAGIKLAADEIRIVRCNDPKYGILDVAYRQVPTSLTDGCGRPFHFIEGVLLRDRDPSVVFCSKHFDAARAAVEPLYEKFRDAKSWSEPEASHSEKIEIVTLPHESPMRIMEGTPTIVVPSDAQGKIESTLSNTLAKSEGWKPNALGIGCVILATVGGFYLWHRKAHNDNQQPDQWQQRIQQERQEGVPALPVR